MSDPVTRLNAALEGRYRIQRELGEGGMATVYLADDLRHERKVALKVLKPELAAVVGAERFLAEIKTTANLQHPHILPLFDSGEADQFLFYVMPYVEGESLRERLDREKQLGVADSLAITQKVADALDYAHENGVVHRDMKPGNILLSPRGEPLVADFGIALAVAQAGGGRITETGLSLGTPHYMSPEQATGDRDVDPRSDVYSLACVLYEMLAGQPPFSASTAQAILAKILTADAPSITRERRTVPPHVGHALARALEKLPADRFASSAQFARALSEPGFTYEVRRGAGRVPAADQQVRPGLVRASVRSNWLALAFAATTSVLATMVAWNWLTPTPASPVTRAMVDAGGATLAAPGEILVSPDGRRLALTGVGGDGRIYWRNADGQDFQPIPGTEGTLLADFSPDGESLVFSTRNGTMQRVSVAGGAPQPVVATPVNNAGGLDWGDDGSIVFTMSGGLGLYRVPYTGGDIEELLGATVQVRNPRMLPGGRAVIFTEPRAEATQLYDIDQDSLWTVRPGAIDAHYIHTGHLLYADISGTLLAVAFDPERGEARGEPVIVLDGVTMPRTYFARFSISDDGATLVYGSGRGADIGVGFQLVVVSLEDGSVQPLLLSGRDVADVDWARDDRTIAYRDISGSEAASHLYTYDLVLESTPRQVTFEGDNRRPIFSPDSRSVVFSSRRNGTDGADLFVKTLDDDAPARLLITLSGDQFPTQWPVDTLIAFESGSPSDLWTLNLSDPTNPLPRAYLSSQSVLNGLSVSPNGTLAAYSSFETGTEEVYVRSFPEAGQRTPVSEGGGRWPQWGVGEETLFYWSVGGIGLEDTFLSARIRTAPVPTVVARDSLFSGDFRRSASGLNRSGDRLLVARNVASASAEGGLERLFVVTNFFEELNRLVPRN